MSCTLAKSLQGELWGWTCFYIGVGAVAFGSAYYHLEPNDARLVWDRLPVSCLCDEMHCAVTIMEWLVNYFVVIIVFDDWDV